LNTDQLWNELLERIKQVVSTDSFELWFRPLKPLSLDEKRFTVQVPNKFFTNWFNEHYVEQLNQFLKDITGKEILIGFSIDPDGQKYYNRKKEEIILPPPASADETQFAGLNLNPRYTFESFVVGPSNRFAQATAEAVSNDPGKVYNPLFIYGGVGLGKTHLLHAIGHAIKKKKSSKIILYITSERFTNDLIDSIRKDRMATFRNKYRNLDVLLIDDIQFLAGKEQTQEAFFHTFNTLYDNHKQIVISSDSTPKDIPTLEERLCSRFQWGVIADLQPPDLETRIAILRKKVELEKIYVPDDVILFLAGKIKSNIRELEGSLIRIVAFSSLTGSEITVDRTKEILKDVLKKDEAVRPISVENIQKVVCTHFHIDTKEMKSKKRTEAIAWPRQIAMYLARNLTELSTTEIGNQFGGRDHTTVMYACEKIKNKLSADPYFSALVNKIINEIKGAE